MSDDPLSTEDLALLLISDGGGLITPDADAELVLAGALLGDLTDAGLIEVRDDEVPDDQAADGRRRSRITRLGGTPPNDPLLADAWKRVDQRRPRAALRRLADELGELLWPRLAERGLISGKLRPFRRPQIMLARAEARDAVRDRLRRVLLDGADPDRETLRVIWLFDACANLAKALPGQDRGAIRLRKRTLPPAGWVERAVRRELEALHTSTTPAE